ncbi:hypothetical protein BVV20_22775 [Xanthomonas oryzae pv. oryzae]|nr:hypothetical protein BVV20_22775 [Xanthomonas oryzae pv. oryzae]
MDASSFRTNSVSHLWCVVQRFPRRYAASIRDENVPKGLACPKTSSATLLSSTTYDRSRSPSSESRNDAAISAHPRSVSGLSDERNCITSSKRSLIVSP